MITKEQLRALRDNVGVLKSSAASYRRAAEREDYAEADRAYYRGLMERNEMMLAAHQFALKCVEEVLGEAVP